MHKNPILFSQFNSLQVIFMPKKTLSVFGRSSILIDNALSIIMYVISILMRLIMCELEITK